ncbi:MAG: hypothetical protein ACRC4T_21025 [Cetobacterium sp.]
MAWACKKCGGEVVQIAVAPMTIIKYIKKDGKSGKILAQQKHKIEHSKDFICLSCKEKAPVIYKDSLKLIAEWED